jgi:demethylmenaquinone methyltransferase/2-methoxy-6-polyprenyl-1,4-benzoquinol methylase
VPQAAQQPWNRTGEQKRAYVRRMFAEISPTYDLLNSAMSLRLHHRWRADAVGYLNLNQGDIAADLCCGTGDFGRPLRRAVGDQGRIIGLDFCQPMLEIAKRKPGDMRLALADAADLPLRSNSVDAITVGWGLRNVPDLDGALREAFRSLKSGGTFVSVDMAKPRHAPARLLGGIAFHGLVPLLGSLFGKREAYTYLPKSTERFASREEIAQAMRAVGFREVGWRDRFFGNICIHWGRK